MEGITAASIDRKVTESVHNYKAVDREAEVGEQKDRKGDVREEQDAEDGEEPLPVCNEGGEEQQIGDADFAQAEAQAMSEVDTHVKVRDQVLDGVGQPLRHRDRVAVVGLRKVKQKMHNGQVGVVMELGIDLGRKTEPTIKNLWG